MADDRPIRASPGGAYALESSYDDESSVADARPFGLRPSPGSSLANDLPIRPSRSPAADERPIQWATKGGATSGTADRDQHLDPEDDDHFHSDDESGKLGYCTLIAFLPLRPPPMPNLRHTPITPRFQMSPMVVMVSAPIRASARRLALTVTAAEQSPTAVAACGIGLALTPTHQILSFGRSTVKTGRSRPSQGVRRLRPM